MLAAALIGALHALGTGHGKTILGAYLIGGRGRPRHAVALAAVVAAMHSASVLVVGLALYALTAASGYPGGASCPDAVTTSRAPTPPTGTGMRRRAVAHRCRPAACSRLAQAGACCRAPPAWWWSRPRR